MPIICEKCNTIFPFHIVMDGKHYNLSGRKYCLKCSPFKKHNTKKLNGESRKGTDIKKYYCKNCNKLLNNSRGKKFCNNKCQNELKRKIRYEKWEKEGAIPTQRQARIYFIHNREYKCEICGITEWHGEPVPLVLDHIDGNSDNNKIKNLRLICRNCDGLLPTYCKKNKGKGGSRSKQRLKNYKQGKKKW